MKNIFEVLKLSSETAVLICSPYNMQYFSGFSGGEGYVLITKDNKYLLVDSRYTGIAKEEAYEPFLIFEFGLNYPLSEMIKNILLENQIKNLAFEDDFISVKNFNMFRNLTRNVEFCPMSDDINKMRMIKSDKEIDLIAKAEQIGVDAFKHILSYIKPGVSEKDIASELEFFMKKNGAEKTSFDTIVLSGERTALPHGMPNDKVIKNGDFLLMDYGCVYNGYCSDMTRTIMIGKADKKQKEIYNTVLNAQMAGLNVIKAGIIGAAADKIARDVIAESGYGEYFGHSLGHGVGLQIHELPNLSPKSDIILEENMIVSCEPGIYIYGYGGVRIEDLVCVKNDGIRNLTNLSKELIEI